MSDLAPITDDESRLMVHVRMWGSTGYPVEKLGRRWIVRDAFGVRISPLVYRTG